MFEQGTNEQSHQTGGNDTSNEWHVWKEFHNAHAERNVKQGEEEWPSIVCESQPLALFNRTVNKQIVLVTLLKRRQLCELKMCMREMTMEQFI